MAEAVAWQDPANAPVWQEVLVKYEGPPSRRSQPDCVGTAVKLEDGTWDLGSWPKYRRVIGWMPFPDGEAQ